VQMEQFFQDNHTYLAGTACNTDTSSSQYFTFSCPVAATASAYQIQAAGIGSMAGFTYTIDENNTKTSTIASPAPSSWQATSGSCWITKQGGAC
jgi:type IV pilus assembly protein PilE